MVVGSIVVGVGQPVGLDGVGDNVHVQLLGFDRLAFDDVGKTDAGEQRRSLVLSAAGGIVVDLQNRGGLGCVRAIGEGVDLEGMIVFIGVVERIFDLAPVGGVQALHGEQFGEGSFADGTVIVGNLDVGRGDLHLHEHIGRVGSNIGDLRVLGELLVGDDWCLSFIQATKSKSDEKKPFSDGCFLFLSSISDEKTAYDSIYHATGDEFFVTERFYHPISDDFSGFITLRKKQKDTDDDIGADLSKSRGQQAMTFSKMQDLSHYCRRIEGVGAEVGC